MLIVTRATYGLGWEVPPIPARSPEDPALLEKPSKLVATSDGHSRIRMRQRRPRPDEELDLAVTEGVAVDDKCRMSKAKVFVLAVQDDCVLLSTGTPMAGRIEFPAEHAYGFVSIYAECNATIFDAHRVKNDSRRTFEDDSLTLATAKHQHAPASCRASDFACRFDGLEDTAKLGIVAPGRTIDAVPSLRGEDTTLRASRHRAHSDEAGALEVLDGVAGHTQFIERSSSGCSIGGRSGVYATRVKWTTMRWL